MSAVPPSPLVFPGDTGICIGCWCISCHSGSISSSQQIDAFYDETHIRCPEMVYLDNHLTLTHLFTGERISFNTRDALKGVGKQSCDVDASSSIKVPSASLWQDKKHEVDVVEMMGYDWTYTTNYTGTLSSSLSAIPSNTSIPVSLLSRPDPILWYKQVPLYEDELHDNGVASLSVKIRVMPTCWLVLQTFWLRVDDVCINMLETRCFSQFHNHDSINIEQHIHTQNRETDGSTISTNTVIREVTRREETFQSLVQRGLSKSSASYSDPSVVARMIKVIGGNKETINFTYKADKHIEQQHRDKHEQKQEQSATPPAAT